jgi:hypothetical protein
LRNFNKARDRFVKTLQLVKWNVSETDAFKMRKSVTYLYVMPAILLQKTEIKLQVQVSSSNRSQNLNRSLRDFCVKVSTRNRINQQIRNRINPRKWKFYSAGFIAPHSACVF